MGRVQDSLYTICLETVKKFMQPSKRYLHDRVILIFLTIIAILVVIGVSSVLLRFDASQNSTTIAGYRPNLSSSTYVSGNALDIYELPLFMILISAIGIILSVRLFRIARDASLFMLASTTFLLVISIITANALIALQ
jgi:hypothetical protein